MFTILWRRKLMSSRYRFNRMEMAGSLGDLGTLLPIAIGMILINGLNPMGMFISIGLYYILSGMYFELTVPVQPMKIIGAYAIATAMTASQIMASAALMGVFLLIIGGTNAITVIGRYTPKSVIRGVQLSTGILLMSQGFKFIIGSSKFQMMRQMAEPYLTIQHLGPVPTGILIGIIGGVLTLLLLENKKFPAGLVIVLGGIILGLFLGTHEGLDKLKAGIYFPELLPFGIPSQVDFVFALFALVLPQLPMTLGNAVVASADLSQEYFGDDSKKVTYRALTISMALANLASFLLGGMPLCHGAGGLAAHYRFGARTAGSNLMIGSLILIMGLFFGAHALSLVYLVPMAVLGVLLVFAGGHLALTVIDMKTRKELFVALLILGITLASNLAAGFIVGIAVAYALKSDKLTI